MGWSYYNVKDHVHHPNGHHKDFEHSYWQVNLMCHLLREFPYRVMFETPAYLAMARFQLRVLEIDDENLYVHNKELDKKTKKLIAKEFEALATEFERIDKTLKMRDLYTKRLALPKATLDHFVAIQRLLAADTHKQKDPENGTKKRFAADCQMCIPFLKIQDGSNSLVSDTVINDFTATLGHLDLAGLFKLPLATLINDKPALKAFRAARASGLLSSEREDIPGTRIIHFPNNLQCDHGACVPNAGTYCSTASDGNCSAMSSP